MKIISTSFLLSLLLLLAATADACSDILVTPGASKDGSAMIGYNADDAALYGVLYHYPATQNNTSDEMVQIHDWDTGVSTTRKKGPNDMC